MPDDNPYYAPMRPEPSKERLNAPSSRVIVKNTSEVQNHIVIDRFNVGHELRPGEAREMEMLDVEIANFQEQRRPDRFYPGTTTPKPLHPIIIEGVPSMVQGWRALRITVLPERCTAKRLIAVELGDRLCTPVRDASPDARHGSCWVLRP